MTLLLLMGLLAYAIYIFVSLMTKPYTWQLLTYESKLEEGKVYPLDLGVVEAIRIQESYEWTTKDKNIDVNREFGHFEIENVRGQMKNSVFSGACASTFYDEWINVTRLTSYVSFPLFKFCLEERMDGGCLKKNLRTKIVHSRAVVRV